MDPIVNNAELFDEAEELKTLFRLFSNVNPDCQNDTEACSLKVAQSVEMNLIKREFRPCVIPDALPPPSSFLRRSKTIYAIPTGPSFVEADVEPTACKASSPPDKPHDDEYAAVFDYLMNYSSQLEPTSAR